MKRETKIRTQHFVEISRQRTLGVLNHFTKIASMCWNAKPVIYSSFIRQKTVKTATVVFLDDSFHFCSFSV